LRRSKRNAAGIEGVAGTQRKGGRPEVSEPAKLKGGQGEKNRDRKETTREQTSKGS